MVSTLLSKNATALLTNIDTTTIAETAFMLRPPLIKNESDAEKAGKGTSFGIASITDFPESGYLSSTERQIIVQEQNNVAQKYSLQPHDVMLSIVGSIGRVAIIGPDYNGKMVPSSNIVIIRMHEPSAQKAILCGMFYKSAIGQQILADLTHGKTIPLISKKTLASTPFPAATEKNLAAALALFEQETLAEEKCRQLREDIKTARSNFLIDDTHSSAN